MGKKQRWKLIRYALIILLMSTLYLTHERGRVERPAPPVPEGIGEGPKVEEAGTQGVPADDGRTIIESRIGPGESIYTILTEQGISPGEVYRLARDISKTYDLARVKAGNWYKAVISPQSSILSLEYQIDGEKALSVEGNGDGYRARLVPLDFERVVERISGTIRTSLFDAVIAEGESPQLALELARLYGWDIDFHLDLREEDSFKVLAEKRFLNGEFHSYGKIYAAEFINAGRVHRAFYFDDGRGRADYYDEEGNSLRRQFLKSPLKFGRVTSRFSRKRFHPIRRANMPHLGVDYAAPTGAPVVATADGKVLTARFGKGNGRYIKIAHGNSYVTYYLHLSGFARGIKAGKKVKQGQVIGYVGSTGMATGPHLDYRIKKGGRFIDPLKFRSRAAGPVGKEDMERFRNLRDRLLKAMNGDTAVLTDLLPPGTRTVN